MLDSLPAEQAETVRLKCYDNLTFRQIAELTEISEATVNSRCRYANTYSETIRIEEEIWMLNIKPKSTPPIWAFK
ncbi:MAG: hypothetical protein J6B91_05555 [Prevotella sp.]|nr:hypothetical protein [Prevotella sp.]